MMIDHHSIITANSVELIRYKVRIAVTLLLQSQNEICIALKPGETNDIEPILIAYNNVNGEHSLLLTKYEVTRADEEPTFESIEAKSRFLSPEGCYNLGRCFESWQQFKKFVLQSFVSRQKFFYNGLIDKAIVLVESNLDADISDSVFPVSLNEEDSLVNAEPSSAIGYRFAASAVSKLSSALVTSCGYSSKCKRIKLSESYERRVIENHLEDFYSHLLLIANQPDETEIADNVEQLLEGIISHDEQMDAIFQKIIDWFLTGAFRNRSGLINLIRIESARICARNNSIVKLSAEYRTHLNKFNVKFEERAIAELRNAIFNADIHSIIHVKPANSTILSAIKTSQALTEEGKELSLVVPGEALLRNFQEDLFFCLPRCSFLVVVCTNQHQTLALIQLVEAYSRLIGGHSRYFSPMKLVVVAPELDNAIVVKISDMEISWSHLTADSRQYHIKKPINYNGYVTDLLKLTNEKVREVGWFDNAMLEEYLTSHQLDISSIDPPMKRKNCLVSKKFQRLVEIDRGILTSPLANRLCTSSADFEERCRVSPDECIHRCETIMDESGERLFWRQTHGSIKELRTYVVKNVNEEDQVGVEEVTEGSWVSQKSKVDVVLLKESAEFPLFESLKSKTTVLDKLPNWHFFVDLLKIADTLNEFDKCRECLEAANFLTNNVIAWPDNSKIAKKLFESRLLDPEGGVILVFSGFNKIDSNCWGNVFGLFEALKSLPGIERLVIFSRPNERFSCELEDRLNQFAFTVPEPCREDEVNYLVQYWTAKIGESFKAETSVYKFASDLIKAITPSTTLGNYKIGAHVICQLLAEMALEDARKIANDGAAENMQQLIVPAIFGMLWKIKLDTLKDSDEVFVETLKAICQRIAIQCVLSQKEAQAFWHRDNFFRMVGIQTVRRCAKVISDTGMFGENLQFIDRSVAEYFVAQYFFDCLQQEDCPVFYLSLAQDVIFKGILVKNEYQGVRFFLNWMLEPHLKCLKFDSKIQVRNAIVTQSAFNDRLILLSGKSGHPSLERAVRDGHASILTWLLFCAHDSLIRKTNGFLNGDDIGFLNARNAASLVSIVDSSEGGYRIVKIIFSWFEKANVNNLKEFAKFICLDSFCCHPNAVMEFIVEHRAKLDDEYLLHLFFDSDCFLTRQLEDASHHIEDILFHVAIIFNQAVEQLKLRMTDWFVKLEPRCEYSEVVPFITRFLVDNMALDGIRKVVSHAIKMCPTLFEKLYWHKPTYPSDVRKAFADRGFDGLNHAQRAALLAQTASLRQVLNDIRWLRSRQDPDAPQLIASVSRDEYGATALYLSAVRGHSEICELLLDFFNDVFTADELTLLLTESQGCLFRALTDSVMRQSEEAALKTLHAVEGKLCSRALFNLLMRGPDGSRKGTLFVKALDWDCWKVARKVAAIVSKRLGQQGLTDLLREETVFPVMYRLVDCNENETLDQVLESLITCKGDSFLVHQLLRGDDLKRGVVNRLQEINDIVSVLKNEVVRRYIPQRLGSSALSHFIHLLTTVIKLSAKESSKTSVWTVYCTQIDCFNHVDAILFSVSKDSCLGESTVNELALHNLALGGLPLIACLKKIKAEEMIAAFLRYSPRSSSAFVEDEGLVMDQSRDQTACSPSNDSLSIDLEETSPIHGKPLISQ